MNKIRPTDLPEVVTTLYLRLNGFFTSGLVLHSEVWGQDNGDVDCVAVWHPFHDQSEREVAPDPFLELGARRELLLCEVKSSAPALSFNERLRTDPRALDSALRWSGLIPPERLKETVDRLLPLLQDGATIDEVRAGVEVDGVRIRALLCCPGCDSEPEPPRWCVRGAAMLDYINRCLNPRAPREKCSTRYSFKLWGGFLAPLVEYVKSLPSDQPPSIADLRRSITSAAP
jgi:hypothetical protein